MAKKHAAEIANERAAGIAKKHAAEIANERAAGIANLFSYKP